MDLFGMSRHRLNFLIILLLFQTEAFSQSKISNIDLSYWFNDSYGVTGKILCAREDSIATLLIKTDQSLDSLRIYQLSYSLQNSLEEENKTRYKLAPISTYFQYEDKTGAYFGIKINVRDYRYVVLWFEDTSQYVRYPLVKDLKANRSFGDVAMYRLNFNVPIVSNFLPVNSAVRLRPLDGTMRNLLVKHFDYNFMPALPPMAQAEAGSQETFRSDAEFDATTNDTIIFDNPGLYYFELNGANMGQSVIITDEQYPGTNSFDELIRNLRYIATKEEYEKMSSSFNKKELFDKFWLNNTKSEEKAREAVRQYYQRVRAANAMFTNYKEGWKTDRGMIYIIFGSPSRVFINDEVEMWIYEKSFELPRVSFTFARVETAFTEEHYVLMRNAEYQNLWFRVVDLWRKGKKEY